MTSPDGEILQAGREGRIEDEPRIGSTLVALAGCARVVDERRLDSTDRAQLVAHRDGIGHASRP